MYPISMVIFVFCSEKCGYSAFPSMGFQVFGLVMGWHLIGQWQCRAESLDPAIEAKLPQLLRYGCHGTDLALYAKGSGGNGQVGSSELCWCESSSMGTGWSETGDWWSRGAWMLQLGTWDVELTKILNDIVAKADAILRAED